VRSSIVKPSMGIGSPTSIATGPRRTRNSPFGQIAWVPAIAIGSTGSPKPIAVAKAPFLNACRAPSRERVPSAKNSTETSLARRIIPFWIRSMSRAVCVRTALTFPVRRSACPKATSPTRGRIPEKPDLILVCPDNLSIPIWFRGGFQCRSGSLAEPDSPSGNGPSGVPIRRPN
jgi:hypothetical protein